MMSQIFLSHVNADTAIATELALGLEAAGYSTWYYERDSVPGETYLHQVADAIDASRVVTVILSAAALASPRQMDKEIVKAHEEGKVFLPILCGLSHHEFRETARDWAMAMGAATSVELLPGGVSQLLLKLLSGLERLGIRPENFDAGSVSPEFAGGMPSRESSQALRIAETQFVEAFASFESAARAVLRHKSFPDVQSFSPAEILHLVEHDVKTLPLDLPALTERALALHAALMTGGESGTANELSAVTSEMQTASRKLEQLLEMASAYARRRPQSGVGRRYWEVKVSHEVLGIVDGCWALCERSGTSSNLHYFQDSIAVRPSAGYVDAITFRPGADRVRVTVRLEDTEPWLPRLGAVQPQRHATGLTMDLLPEDVERLGGVLESLFAAALIPATVIGTSDDMRKANGLV